MERLLAHSAEPFLEQAEAERVAGLGFGDERRHKVRVKEALAELNPDEVIDLDEQLKKEVEFAAPAARDAPLSRSQEASQAILEGIHKARAKHDQDRKKHRKHKVPFILAFLIFSCSHLCFVEYCRIKNGNAVAASAMRAATSLTGSASASRHPVR